MEISNEIEALVVKTISDDWVENNGDNKEDDEYGENVFPIWTHLVFYHNIDGTIIFINQKLKID